MEYTTELVEAVVNIHCGVCGQKFRMGDEVRQLIVGKLGWIKDIGEDGFPEWVLAIIQGDVSDVHVRCVPKVN
jgi:hypothetical protein